MATPTQSATPTGPRVILFTEIIAIVVVAGLTEQSSLLGIN